jgi:hypothetical protein
MDVVVFGPEELPVALGGLRALVATPTARQKRFLEIVSRLHGAPIRAERIWPAPLTLVATGIRGTHQRKRLVQLAVVMSMTGAHVEHAMAHAVADLATALAVDEPAVPVLALLADERALATRAYVLSRVLRRHLVAAYRDAGLAGLHGVITGFIPSSNRALAERYAALARYPAESLGRAVWEHCQREGIQLPGARGAISERTLAHEIGRVLSGYNSDTAGNIQQGAFEAGYVRDDGFAKLFGALIQFHFGIRLSPLTAAAVGRFDVEHVMTALARGAACKVDLEAGWDFWEAASLPLASVREKLGIQAPAERQLASAQAS